MISTGLIEFLYLFYSIKTIKQSDYIIIVINIIFLVIIGFIILFLFTYQIKLKKLNLTTIEEGNKFFRNNLPFK